MSLIISRTMDQDERTRIFINRACNDSTTSEDERKGMNGRFFGNDRHYVTIIGQSLYDCENSFGSRRELHRPAGWDRFRIKAKATTKWNAGSSFLLLLLLFFFSFFLLPHPWHVTAIPHRSTKKSLAIDTRAHSLGMSIVKLTNDEFFV